MSSSESPWKWSEEHQKYYRQEYLDGTWKTIWEGEAQTQPATSAPTQTSNERRPRIDSGPSDTRDEIDEHIYRVTSHASTSSVPSHPSSASSPSTLPYPGGQWQQFPQQISHYSQQPSHGQVSGWPQSASPSAPPQQLNPSYYANPPTTAGAANPGNEVYFQHTGAQVPPTPAFIPSESGPEQSPGQLISGTRGATERLDPSYYIKHKWFFEIGRMFSVLFHEGVGSTASADNNDCVSLVKYGEQVYSQIRRFVVVKSKREFCFACPVYTYNNQGTLKRGVDPSEHAIIYTTGDQPTLLPNETGIEKRPIAVDPVDPSNPESSGHPLHYSSRIYFGIFHAIQYNVKVKDMGKVSPHHLARLRGYWQQELAKR